MVSNEIKESSGRFSLQPIQWDIWNLAQNPQTLLFTKTAGLKGYFISTFRWESFAWFCFPNVMQMFPYLACNVWGWGEWPVPSKLIKHPTATWEAAHAKLVVIDRRRPPKHWVKTGSNYHPERGGSWNRGTPSDHPNFWLGLSQTKTIQRAGGTPIFRAGNPQILFGSASFWGILEWT